MGYQVDIAIFTADTEGVETPTDLSWSIVQAEGDVDDTIAVLDGLAFGWTTPANGVWPAQPNPMTCALAINCPDFSDISVLEGDTLSVEVKADSAGDVIAPFYGNVTNWQAVNRPDDRSGVTLSLVAVDPMAGLNELQGVAYPDGVTDAFLEERIVSALWGSFAGPDDVSDLWTSPARFIWPASVTFAEPVNTLTVVNQILLQAVDVDDETRMIVSPNIASSGAIHSDPISGRSFTLDTVSSDVDADTDPFSPPANATRRDAITWTNATGQNPGRIVAAGFAGDAANMASSAVEGSTSRASQVISVICNDEAEAQDTADFYADTGFDQWQADAVTVEVTRKDVDVPLGLFPNWKAAEGDPGRAACYSRRVRIAGINPTRTPDGTGVIAGVLVGATCRITGGALSLDLAVRRPIAAPGDPGDFILGGYALAPYAGLADA